MNTEISEAINILTKIAKKQQKSNPNLDKIKELLLSFKEECSTILKSCKKDLVKKTFFFIQTFLEDIKEHKIVDSKLEGLVKKFDATIEVLNANKKYFQLEKVKYKKEEFSKLCSLVNKTSKKLNELVK